MKLITGKSFLKAAAIGAALMTSTSAFAQWQGTWRTTYGEVKLQESGKYVYGDYGTWGTIEGLKSDDGKTMRGVYRRNDDGTSGYFEWRMAGSVAFVGRWVKPNQTLPKWNSGGTEWAGNRKSTASPRLVVYRGGGNIGAFMGAQQAKYQRWAGSLYASSGTSSTTAAAPKKAVNPLTKRLPKLADYPANFTPGSFEVRLDTVQAHSRRTDVYGTMGIYAYCETATTSKRLVSFGNLAPRVFDQPRSAPARASNGFPYRFGQSEVRKFLLDKSCMQDPRGRIKVQIQTNLNERDELNRDEKFGYRSFHFYLDQLITSKQETETIKLAPRRYIALLPTSTEEAGFSFNMYEVQIFDDDGLTVRGHVKFLD